MENNDDAHWQALLARLKLQPASSEPLRKAYAQPDRHYHTGQHLAECLEALAQARQHHSIPNADAIQLALWFHDAVYDPRAPDNEEKSAELAVAFLQPLGASPTLLSDIQRLILATKRHHHNGHEDAKWLIDIDLAILGKPTDRFQEYEHQIRQEYAWVPLPIYKEKRAEVLQGFRNRPRLYETEYFYEMLESQARQNFRTPDLCGT